MKQKITINYKKYLGIILILAGLLPLRLYAQQRITISEFIETYRALAIQEMRQHGIPASIKLAQGILESAFGNSELAVNANNHFGIKCHGWPGRGYLYDDDEKGECFRMYNDPVESWLDHSQFLRTRPRYAFLFQLDPLDYRAWAHGLRSAGYATNPNYPEHLIRIIEEHQLHQYDRWGMNVAAELPAGRISPNNRSGVSAQRTEEPTFAVTGPRQELSNNRIRYIIARPGDTPESLAAELGYWAWQIRRYNELEDGRELRPGQMVYLQPKRRRGSQNTHQATPGESMYDISQKYGIRLQNLYQRNQMTPPQEPRAGQVLLLRGRMR